MSQFYFDTFDLVSQPKNRLIVTGYMVLVGCHRLAS